jgi:hypothetical protein
MIAQEEFIKHLSSEIETLTNAAMTFRTRIAFIVYLGPFVLFSSVLVGIDNVPNLASLSSSSIVILSLILCCYLGLGILGGRFERLLWNQCNEWRGLIHSMITEKEVLPSPQDMRFEQKWFLIAYSSSFFLLALSFVLIIILIVGLSR